MAGREFALDRGGVTIAGFDHPGDGPPLVLLPGFGTNVLSLGALVEQLTDFRVVTIDLRGHGASGEPQTVTMSDLVDDVEAVDEHLGLGRPAVAGHSLGGMLAVAYGRRHPECPGVVNIDGGHFLESDADIFEELEPEVREAFEALAARAGPRDEPSGDMCWVDEQVQAAMAAYGISTPGMEAFLRRDYAADEHGVYRRRPTAAFTRKVLDAIEDGGTAAWAHIGCPILVFVTTRREGESAEVLGRIAQLRADGLVRKQDDARAAGRDVTVVRVDTTHQMVVFATAADVAEHVRRFLRGER